MTVQKVVIRVTMVDQKKSRVKAMKIAATAFGVQSVALSGDSKDQIEVTGEGIDTVELAKLLRKKIGSADLLSVGPAKADDKKDEKKNEASVVWGSQPYYYYNSYPVVYDHSPSCTLM
ncbi:putative Heavy metal transport/detoxification superfamily protein [Heracleum sosnowskyi]|uniref:Heavy metal transport/detoxification superfamily protein n=1 Tax=Heracleum sosnowskyi TaxID=360622 RepID=A0AAD8JLA5_9APIA|nr:putative Heavy metal transport/detoxification superfamily protein [Heracleum sosnowskyi]